MTKDDAIFFLNGLRSANNCDETIDMAIAALRGPQPDPDTGLMPCGCGGKAMHMVWPDENFPNGLRLYVICGECMTETSGFNETNENAANRWNRAMGWRASE